MNKAAAFREMMERAGVIRLVGAHNGLTARLVEKHGFDGIWASGLEISTSHALPDANILTMTEYLAAAAEMNDACGLPVIADCDTGYGNSNNVMHMVRRYEDAGIAGVCIEDKKFPKVNSYVPGRQELAPIGEFVGKIMAGKAAQRTGEFVLVARVEALIAGWGQDEALKRAHAYADAGADMLLMHSKSKTDTEIREFLGRWQRRLPVVIVPTTYPRIDLAALEQLGVKVVIYANHGIRAAIRAVDAVLTKMREDGGIAALTDEDIVPMSEVFDLQGMTRMKQVEKKYLSPDKAVILAAGGPNNASLERVLGDRPVAMLDINGKSLLQRNVETINRCGIQNVDVVVGYRKEAVSLDGVTSLENPDYARTASAASLLRAEPGKAERVLVVYGDVIVDRHLVRRALEQAGDVVAVVDDSYRRAPSERNLDFAVVEQRPETGHRTIDAGGAARILAIGKDVTKDRATHEFVGVAVFARKAFEVAAAAFAGRPDAAGWGVPDLIAALAAQGLSVTAVAVNSGWKEIHTFEHYRQACAMVG